jgi:hypothetical protein
MIPVDQEFLHKPEEGSIGDCMRACLASVLELPISAVPHFAKLYPTAPEFWNELMDWVELQGYDFSHVVPLSCIDPERFYIVGGPSPRSGRHAVVSKGMDIVHDPHPSRAGLAGSATVWRFAELRKV